MSAEARESQERPPVGSAPPNQRAPAGFLTLSPATSLALNLIRVLSSQIVVIGHAANFFYWQPLSETPHAPEIQNIGVVAFFLLSGFLITHSTARKMSLGHYDFRKFFIERFVRIYSGLIPALCLIALIDYLHARLSPVTFKHLETFTVGSFAATLLMLQEHPIALALNRLVPDLSVPARFGSARPLWTVAVEWWTYLTFGWLFLRGAWSRERTGRIPGIFILAVLSAVPIWNLFTGYGNGLTMTWIFGAVLALLCSSQPLIIATPGSGSTASHRSVMLGAIGFGVAALLRIYFFTKDAYDPMFWILLAFAFFFLIAWLQSESVNQSRWAQPLAFLADYSYVLYLIHYTVLECFLPFRTRSSVLLIVVSWVVANIVSLLLASVTEMHYRKLSRKALRMVGAS